MRWLAGILVALLVCGVAQADDPLAEAREHYRKGTALYDLRRYAEAAKEYEQAFMIKDDPVLLFNIGQAYRFAGDYENAIASYKAYLRRIPKAPNRAEVEARILELQKLQEDRRRPQTNPPIAPSVERAAERPAGEKTPPVVEKPAAPVEKPAPVVKQTPPSVAAEKPGRVKIIAGAAVMAVGVALIAVGGAFAAQTQSESDSISHAPAGSTFDHRAEERAFADRAVAIAGFAVGGAALVAGASVLVLGVRARARARVTAAPVAARNAIGLSLAGSF